MMNKENKKYKVTILGESYSIVSDESQELVARAASLVDVRMQEISQVAGMTDQKKIAVLAALQLASELVRLQQDIEQHAHTQKTLADLIDRVLPSTLY